MRRSTTRASVTDDSSPSGNAPLNPRQAALMSMKQNHKKIQKQFASQHEYITALKEETLLAKQEHHEEQVT